MSFKQYENESSQVEAVQWDGTPERGERIKRWLLKNGGTPVFISLESTSPNVWTLRGTVGGEKVVARDGHWFSKDQDGALRAWTDEDFNNHYQEVEEWPESR